MIKKRRRQNKKRFIFLLIPTFLLLIGALFVAIGIFLPRLNNFLSKNQQIKSAYIHTTTKKEVEKALQDEKIQYTSIEFNSDSQSYQITLEKGTIVKVTISKSLDEQVNTLHNLLRRLTIDNKQVKIIDLRFTRPIVKF